ncbi:hypothetical protein [Clostridium paraputrificum]|uniref:hypothetical protein n=1 Tax=Clostridium paraputrificum TaxID=29363 RepID=UPI00232CC22F|nr:hypothetical protein [Clostridium paraputrificum]MDB2105598.1 hypothetical protein [Clostridium paraputrificum]MDB2112161.1 hypothetical protein [Clostridium paraputrificum]
MHISWKCSTCSEDHVNIIDNLTLTTNTQLNLKCINCNSEFIYIVNSIKYTATCIVNNLNSDTKSNDNIIAF